MHHSTLYYSSGGLVLGAAITAVYIYWSRQSSGVYERTNHLEKARSALD